MKRIGINRNIRKGRARASRTSPPNISIAVTKGITLNSAHGLRLSKSWGALQTAVQNRNFILKGRWNSKSGTNLNLSKSGISISQNTSIGAFNMFDPKKSSANLVGLNIRGTKAAKLILIPTVFELVVRFFLAFISAALIILRLGIYAFYFSAISVKFCCDLIIFFFLSVGSHARYLIFKG